MTYATLLADEREASQFLAVLSPRRIATGFTLHSGAVYKITFSYGPVVGFDVDGVALTAGTSSTLSSGRFWHDLDTNILYVRNTDGSNPSGHTNVVKYEIHMGTFDAHFYRDPLDTATTEVYYEPVIVSAPTIRSSSSDMVFGFAPVNSSTLVLSNATHLLEHHLYDSSFSGAELKLYHWVGPLSTANIKKVMSGVVSSLTYDDERISLGIYDAIQILKNEFRHSIGPHFYSTTNFPNLDPAVLSRPIRAVYGVVEGFPPVNISYVRDNPTTSDNRAYCVMAGQAYRGFLSFAVIASPSSTTTRTYVGTNHGFQVDDSIWLDRSVGTDEYKIVTAVGSNYVEHTTLTGGAMATGDFVKRSFVGNVVIIQGDVAYLPLYGRDYTENNTAGNTSGITFTNNFEATLGMGTLTTSDKIYCRVYGLKNNVTLGGNPFGGDDSDTGTMGQAIVILFDLLKRSGLPESAIDTAIFTSLQATLTDKVGFCIPADSSSAFPSYLDIIAGLLETLMLKLLPDADLKWTVSLMAPLGADTDTIDDNEIISGAFQYDFDYNELVSDVIVQYGYREIPDLRNARSSNYRTVSAHSNNAEYLHKINKQKTFTSLHRLSAEADTLATRLSYVFGERNGSLTIGAPKRLFLTEIGHVVGVSRTRMPGLAYDGVTELARSFGVLDIEKGLERVTLKMNDQKGVEDNAGSW